MYLLKIMIVFAQDMTAFAQNKTGLFPFISLVIPEFGTDLLITYFCLSSKCKCCCCIQVTSHMAGIHCDIQGAWSSTGRRRWRGLRTWGGKRRWGGRRRRGGGSSRGSSRSGHSSTTSSSSPLPPRPCYQSTVGLPPSSSPWHCYWLDWHTLHEMSLQKWHWPQRIKVSTWYCGCDCDLSDPLRDCGLHYHMSLSQTLHETLTWQVLPPIVSVTK